MSNYSPKKEKEFTYIETKESGNPLLLLHGLFGALSNFEGIIDYFGEKINVVVPILPIMEMPLISVSISGLVKHVEKFVEYKGYKEINVLGNSLGGHIALLFALSKPELINTIILTGSSGLFENAFGSSFPKRGDYEFIKKKTESTFYRPEVATKELIDEVYDIVNDRNKGLRVVKTAKSAVRHNLADKLHVLKAPTLLVWGKDDTITPPFVAEQFNELIENTELHLLDECGHAPMMEHPLQFNLLLESFIGKNNGIIIDPQK